MLSGKKILLGITGGIAAYKAAILVRLLIKSGAEVKTVMSPSAKEFISPVTIATLSRNKVLSEFFNAADGDWNSHVEMGLWADAFIIAPATANTMAKMAHGISDNLLLTTYLSMRCSVIIAPAMDLDMLKHPATLANMEILQKRGHLFIEAATGELASGLSGKGRMAEPEEIVSFVQNYFTNKNKLLNKSVLITAGPTYELIDPVRFIGNFSSGKMGYALAEACALQGANVTLVSGPVSVTTQNPNISVIKVISATEMLEKCQQYFNETDITILAAAVADYKPVQAAKNKIKKAENELTIQLIKNQDIAATLGLQKTDKQIIIGFALETENELQHAQEKMVRKNFDFIVLNSLNDQKAGFGLDTNKITICYKNNTTENFEAKSKKMVAEDIVDRIANILK